MRNKNKIVVILGLLAFTLIGMAAGRQGQNFQQRNLKVLPKDISDKALDSIMNSYEKALGIKCDFCHVKTKSDPQTLDYPNDAKPEKEIARNMMRMTNDINRIYFHFNTAESVDDIQAVTCKTCHRGEPHPEIE